MTIQRRLSAVALLAALIGMGADGARDFAESRRPARYRDWQRASGYKPHQSKRECARRIGGQVWAEHRAADRVNRGLA